MGNASTEAATTAAGEAAAKGAKAAAEASEAAAAAPARVQPPGPSNYHEKASEENLVSQTLKVERG